MQIERQLLRIEDARFVAQSHQIVKRVQALLSSTDAGLARLRVETSEAWKTLSQQEGRDEYDEALLWLGELLDAL